MHRPRGTVMLELGVLTPAVALDADCPTADAGETGKNHNSFCC
jgi:hypothetical protein